LFVEHRPETLAEVKRIASLGLKELQALWLEQRGQPTKMQSVEFLRYMLAWEVQAKAYGGLSADTVRQLKQLYERFERDPSYTPSPVHDLKPGTTLTRRWKGTEYRVKVLEDGFQYAGQRFPTLSEIARLITGTRWSGPLFFGLRKP
jgi:hypothetical protein